MHHPGAVSSGKQMTAMGPPPQTLPTNTSAACKHHHPAHLPPYSCPPPLPRPLTRQTPKCKALLHCGPALSKHLAGSCQSDDASAACHLNLHAFLKLATHNTHKRNLQGGGGERIDGRLCIEGGWVGGSERELIAHSHSQWRSFTTRTNASCGERRGVSGKGDIRGRRERGGEKGERVRLGCDASMESSNLPLASYQTHQHKHTTSGNVASLSMPPPPLHPAPPPPSYLVPAFRVHVCLQLKPPPALTSPGPSHPLIVTPPPPLCNHKRDCNLPCPCAWGPCLLAA